MIEQTLNKQFLDLSKDQREIESDLMAKENVVGVALGHKWKDNKDTGDAAFHVLVRQKMAPEMLSKDDLVPKQIKGQKTDVIEVGEIVASPLAPDIETLTQLDLQSNTAKNGNRAMREELEEMEAEPADRIRYRRPRRMSGAALEVSPEQLHQRTRPVMGGFSVGHYAITAGTIATCCYDLTPFPGVPQAFYILSNNHVLADSNSANIGDPILQPGPYDGGQYPRDMIGRLSRFVPIRFMTSTSTPLNYVDAAIAEVPFHMASREVYWIGHIRELYTAPNVGDIVQKTGRTTNFTTGTVQSVNATVDVSFGGGRTARFAQQIITTNMSAGGDSGSLVTTLDEKAVGLLFAGSPYVTVLNNILYVQSLLNIRIHEQ